MDYGAAGAVGVTVAAVNSDNSDGLLDRINKMGQNAEYEVKGFPTIKLVKGKQIIEYDARPNKATLIEFVNSSLA